MALIILSDDQDFEAMEVVDAVDGDRLCLEFRMDASSCRVTYVGDGVEIPLLRASLEVFREEFLAPRWAAGVATPPW
ncbi:hypothetical protein OG216_36825 [Streptomycetaceae bacterium NBC_01309]